MPLVFEGSPVNSHFFRGIQGLIWVVEIDKRSITGEFAQGQLTFFFLLSNGWASYKDTSKKNETKQIYIKNALCVLLHVYRVQLKQARQRRLPPGALTESMASESCQTFPFPPRWCGLRLSRLMDKQGSLPAKRWTTLRKQTNKSNQASDLEANDRYDWSGDQLEAVTTRLRETGRVWLFHGPEIITGC